MHKRNFTRVLTKIDVNTLPIFDIEYIFLQIRSKSVESIKSKITMSR